MTPGKKLFKLLTPIVFLLILIFSFYFNFESGRRGFFPLDQSIVFDGSYRILKGQIPYKDFLIPVGPVPFYIHSLFFKISGVKYSSYLLGSSFINLLATVLSFFIVYLIFPSKRWLSLSGAFLTAIWFYPPSGTPYIEQNSFFMSLLGILFLLSGLFFGGLASFLRILLLFLSGFFSFLSILSKQNAGFIVFPVYFLLIISYKMPEIKKVLNDSFCFLAGFLVSLLLFSLYLILFSDPGNFLKHAVILPLKAGMERFFPKGLLFILRRIGPIYFLPANGLFFLLSISFLILYFYNSQNIRDKGKNVFVASILCAYLIISQSIFNLTANNQPEMGIPFTGIIFSVGIGIILSILEVMKIKIFHGENELKLPSKRLVKTLFIIFLFISGTLMAIKGGKVSLNREAHDIFEKSVFKDKFSVEDLKGLKWGEPTVIKGCEVKAEDIENIIHFLRRKRRNFFVFPDFTIFYGLLNSPPPQPILWFHKGLTYPSTYDRALDERVVKDLKRRNVEILVFEECSWFGTPERLDSFQLLKSFINENFKVTRKIGIFIIYENIKK